LVHQAAFYHEPLFLGCEDTIKSCYRRFLPVLPKVLLFFAAVFSPFLEYSKQRIQGLAAET
jgi:hypothetical protein